jgi:segregation and condensation protein A
VSAEYRVHLEAFEGPLDLLLFLIRRAEVDITDIPVATIADQYMGYLAGIEKIDIDLAGEFLVMAATLMEIKSRMIQPSPPPPEAGAGLESSEDSVSEDPRAELVRQLLAFKRFRDASHELESRKSDWDRRFPSGRAGVDSDSLREAMIAAAEDVELDDVSLVDLAGAFAKIEASVNFDRLGEHTVTYDDTPIELHAEDILDRLRREGTPEPVGQASRLPAAGTAAPNLPARMTLTALFSGRSRGEMLGLFLATLELVRRRAVAVKQDAPGGEIVLELRPAEDQLAPAPPDTSSLSEPGAPATG